MEFVCVNDVWRIHETFAIYNKAFAVKIESSESRALAWKP